MPLAMASVCCGDVGVSFLLRFMVGMAVLEITPRLQLLPCHLLVELIGVWFLA